MTPCAVALVLLMDVSGSVSAPHYDLQRDATAAALRDPRVVQAVLGNAPMALTVIEFGSAQHVVLPWHMIRADADLARAAGAMAGATRRESGATHVGDALAAALHALDEAPCAAERAVIDVSGDGASNGGIPLAGPVAEAAERGVVINALPIVTEAEPDIAAWFRTHAITPGGRVFAATWDGFAHAIRAKLVVDVAGLAVPR